ncbi:MAG: BON domain-containing protein [Planctomycetaceae bacterium]|nr:BON domain-containing protein [Planctomycetaceae bacterium]
MQDMQLLENVEEELNWDPEVTADHISVNVNQGAVKLTGYVTAYPEKLAAVQAVERVYGVQSVADDIQVRPIATAKPDDSQISEAIMNSFRWRTTPKSVKAEVEDGWVTLRGEVEWDYERREAAQVAGLNGVTGLTNLITLKPRREGSDVENRISQALKRNADLDARSIWVTTDGGTVHLYGHVHSWHEKRAAERAAFAAPGVFHVDNEITVTA